MAELATSRKAHIGDVPIGCYSANANSG